MKIRAVDLFCGVGGLTNGIQRTGINVVAGYDILPSCKYPYEFNNHAKFILKDVKDINDNEISELYPKSMDSNKTEILKVAEIVDAETFVARVQ